MKVEICKYPVCGGAMVHTPQVLEELTVVYGARNCQVV